MAISKRYAGADRKDFQQFRIVVRYCLRVMDLVRRATKAESGLGISRTHSFGPLLDLSGRRDFTVDSINPIRYQPQTRAESKHLMFIVQANPYKCEIGTQ